MPPITAVSPLLTEICVITFLVSIDGTEPPPCCGTNWPTESLWISTPMMILLSGVICGVTSRRSTAFLNCVVAAAPMAAAVVYGISVPCSIARLLVVAGDHARARHHLAAAVRLERRQLEVDQVAAAEVDQRQRQRAGATLRPIAAG